MKRGDFLKRLALVVTAPKLVLSATKEEPKTEMEQKPQAVRDFWKEHKDKAVTGDIVLDLDTNRRYYCVQHWWTGVSKIGSNEPPGVIHSALFKSIRYDGKGPVHLKNYIVICRAAEVKI